VPTSPPALPACGVVAWSFADRLEDGEQSRDVERVYTVRSSDGGQTWSAPRKVASDAGVGRAGFDLENDSRSTWVLMWADAGLQAARSTDGGATWAEPRTLAGDVTCADCPGQSRYARVDLVHGAGSAWVAVFASPLHDAERFGYDGDVFAVRSSDNAASWSPATAIDDDAGPRRKPRHRPRRRGRRLRTLAGRVVHTPADRRRRRPRFGHRDRRVA
jgi:hypothetical protein